MLPTKNKILNHSQATRLVEDWKSNGSTVVFTNGCFDLLHPGHIDYLERARNLGDKLIVGVNANVSVKKLKGEDRPIFDEQSRVEMLAALQFIDAVILFDTETPLQLIKALEPDILVKGSDYKIGNIAGADIVLAKGGKVELIDLKAGFSTSNIIEKIRKLNRP